MTASSPRRWGVLLTNVGTPDSPEPGDVRRYLRQFLSDPRVLDINPIGRFLLLELIILPFRPQKSAEAYRQVWTKEGSPLRVFSDQQAAGLRQRLGSTPVELGMQYGQPSIPSALDRVQQAGVEHVVVVPLYPQHSSSATVAAVEAVFTHLSTQWALPSISVVPPFFDAPDFIDAWRLLARPELDRFKPDHVVFSFHGLPERHMRKADATGQHCLVAQSCCDSLVEANRYCYRAQCYATARSLSSTLGLEAARYSVTFQSRLGRTPWIRPYTDVVLPELIKDKGVKRVAVMCPAFVADCLETLEEIGIRAKRDFIAAGGEDLLLIPSLNAHPAWLDALAELVRKTAPQTLSMPA